MSGATFVLPNEGKGMSGRESKSERERKRERERERDVVK